MQKVSCFRLSEHRVSVYTIDSVRWYRHRFGLQVTQLNDRRTKHDRWKNGAERERSSLGRDPEQFVIPRCNKLIWTETERRVTCCSFGTISPMMKVFRGELDDTKLNIETKSTDGRVVTLRYASMSKDLVQSRSSVARNVKNRIKIISINRSKSLKTIKRVSFDR